MVFGKLSRVPTYARNRLKLAVSDALTAAYSLPNPGLQQAAQVPLYQINRLVDRWTDSRSCYRFRVDGVAREGGQPLRAAFIGNWTTGQRNTLLYFEHLLFEDGSVQTTDLGQCAVRQVRKQAERLAEEADIVLVATSNTVTWQPDRGEWVLSPWDVRLVFDFRPGETWENVEHRMKEHSRNIRLVRNKGFTLRRSTSEEDFNFFYDRMYVPLVRERYSTYGDILNPEGLLHVYKQGGFLVFIEDAEGHTVSGGLMYSKGSVVYGLLNGVLDGERALVRQGALSALYYLVIKWCHEQGCRRFDSGVSTPFLSEGVYQHKKCWGFKPTPNWWRPQQLLLWAPQGSAAALAWMEKNLVHPQFSRWGGPMMEKAYASYSKRQQKNGKE